MAASSRATARDRVAWAPRKLICTARVFWMMKIIAAMSATNPMISPVRALLIQVRSRGRRLAVATGGDGAVPLADGGGRVLVVRGWDAVGSGMTLASFQDRRQCRFASPRWSLFGGAGAVSCVGGCSRCLLAGYTRRIKLAIYYRNLYGMFPGVGNWTFLTNHARVLLCIAHDPEARLRDIAASLGITERSAYGIITDLTEAGYIAKQKAGRRNRYQIQAHLPLPEPNGRERTVGEMLDLLARTDARPQEAEQGRS